MHLTHHAAKHRDEQDGHSTLGANDYHSEENDHEDATSQSAQLTDANVSAAHCQ